MDKEATHNNAKIQEFWNNQENIWNYLKNKIFTIGAREYIDVLPKN